MGRWIRNTLTVIPVKITKKLRVEIKVYLNIFFSSGTNTHTKKKHALSPKNMKCMWAVITVPRMIWEEKQTGFWSLEIFSWLFHFSQKYALQWEKNKPQYFMTSPPNQHSLSWNSSLSSSIISAHQHFNDLTDAKRFPCNIHTIRSNHEKAC